MKRTVLSACIVFVVGLLFFPSHSFASTFHLSPQALSLTTNESLTVDIKLSTNQDVVNAVSAYLTYPEDLVDIAWVSYESSAFDITAEEKFGNGKIFISRGTRNGVNGLVTVATLGLRGKKPEKGMLAFLNTSAAAKASDSTNSLVLGESTGAMLTVANTSQIRAEQNMPSAMDTVSPIISDISVSQITYKSVMVSWKTNEPSDSIVEYGLEENNYIFNASLPQLVTNHEIVLSNELLMAGTMLHYRVKSKDSNGNITISKDNKVQLRGYMVTLYIGDTAYKPLRRGSLAVYLNGETTIQKITDGVVILTNMPAGDVEIGIRNLGGEEREHIVIREKEDQSIFVPVAGVSMRQTRVGVLSGLLIIIATFAVLFSVRRKSHRILHRKRK